MWNLIIVGASGMGREVCDLMRVSPQGEDAWTTGGFLDTRPNILQGLGDWPPILDSPFTYQVRPQDRFVCAVGDSYDRLQFGRLLQSRGAKFLRVQHPTAMVGSNSQIGDGCVIYNGIGIGQNVTVGDFVFINSYAGIGHDTVIGDGTTIGPQTCVGGNCKIGKAVYIGANATLVPGAVIEDHAYVGAGSVVLRRVRANNKVFGNPAVSIGLVQVPENWTEKMAGGAAGGSPKRR